MVSEDVRVDALLFLRVLHIVRVILLFILSIVTANSASSYVFPIWSWYMIFFLADLPLLFSILGMKSAWEMGVRVYGLFWTFLLILWLLLTSGYGGPSSGMPSAILWPVIIAEVFVLAKPGSYRSNGSNSDSLSPID